MILVNLAKSWPLVLEGKWTPDQATLGDWYGISEEAIGKHGDSILGVVQERVVTAYDITGHTREEDGRVRFRGVPSQTLAHLVGEASPGAAWVRGAARPVKYVDPDDALGSLVEVEHTPTGKRASIDDCEVFRDRSGSVTVRVPAGTRVTVVSSATPPG